MVKEWGLGSEGLGSLLVNILRLSCKQSVSCQWENVLASQDLRCRGAVASLLL